MPNCKYVAYRLSGLPAGVFGEAYVIVTAMIEADDVYCYEYFIVTKRDKPLLSDSLKVKPGRVPDDLLKVDIDMLISEARQQAEICLYQRLVEKAEQQGQPNFQGYRIELVEMPYMPLHGCWMRGDFVEETHKIAKETRCGELRLYLNALVGSSFERRPG